MAGTTFSLAGLILRRIIIHVSHPIHPTNAWFIPLLRFLWACLNVLMKLLLRKIFTQAYNIRLGTSGLDVAGCVQEADRQGIARIQVPTIVEQDSFLYNTTKDGVPVQGMSMVCCVFVCEMWKHGGVFDEVNQEVNCAEFTNWDDYSLAIFQQPSTTDRPSVCVKADPDSLLCQLMGNTGLFLNDYDTKKEYAHMAEACPSEAQANYTKPPNC